MTVIATAGHVDHGKSSLVQHLTGTDPDRWREEKQRGLTIDLGFATMELPNGEHVSFVDVPGHIKFLRNMLSGVGGIDGCVFVVSAIEGWKPQSEEHLRILDLLGLSRGIVAITKSDLVDEELLELAKMETEDRVIGTFLEGAPIIGTSTVTGEGVAQLRQELDRHITRTTTQDSSRPRLWVDRSFSPAGAGTVITGTLTDGTLSTGDEVVITGASKPARVRSLQNHNTTVSSISPGNRAAINLVGVDHHEVGRGDCLLSPNSWHLTSKIDAEIRVLDSIGHRVERRGAYFVYVGSAELETKIQILGGKHLEPGTSGHIRLYLDRPIPAQPGDRYILRESGRNETVGGGAFLDVDPLLPTTKAQPDTSTERLVQERSWVDAAHLSLITGSTIEPTVGRWVVDASALAETSNELRARIKDAGSHGLDLAQLDEKQRAIVDTTDDLVVTSTTVTIGQPVVDADDHPWLSELRSAGFSPPSATGVDPADAARLVRQKLVVKRDGIFFASSTVHEAAVLLAEHFASKPDGLTVAEIRDIWATSRKYALALLGELDETGITRRRENIRLPGPRLPAVFN